MGDSLVRAEWPEEPLGPVRGEHLGFRWEARRAGRTRLGAPGSYGWVWCGYILVPESLEILNLELVLTVHGGITYRESECPGVIRMGFDCGHYHDARANQDQRIHIAQRGTFRTFQYVRGEIESMAQQLTEIGREHLGEAYLQAELLKARELLDLAEVLDLSVGTE